MLQAWSAADRSRSDAARTELRRCSGSQFDGRVVDAFLTVLERDTTGSELSVAG